MTIRPTLTLRNVYLYLVCFVTIIMILIGLVTTVNNLIDLVYQVPPYVESREILMKNFNDMGETGPYADMTFEEYEALRKSEMALQKERDRAYDVRRLLQSFSIFIVAVPFYVYHWRKIEKEVAAGGIERPLKG